MEEYSVSSQDRDIKSSRFSFSKLSEVQVLNFSQIRDAVKTLHKFASHDRFYENLNNCVTYTLDFLLTYSSILMSNSSAESALLALVGLLRKVIAGLIKNDKEVPDVDRVTALLTELINESHASDVQVTAAQIVTELLTSTSNNFDLATLCHKASATYDKQVCLMDLCRHFQALCKWCRRTDEVAHLTVFSEWMENNFLEYFCELMEYESPTFVELLALLQCYYEVCGSNLAFTKQLLKNMWYLFSCMEYPQLRGTAEEILATLVEKLYCTATLVWPKGRSALLTEIKTLPDNYHEWSNSNLSVFFVLVYLVYRGTGELHWNCDLQKCMDLYLSSSLFPLTIHLKALALLYPVVLARINYDINKTKSDFLLKAMTDCKNLPELLTYECDQMKWLLQHGNPLLKQRVIFCWLKEEEDNTPILQVLNETRTGSWLVQVLLDHTDLPLASRLAEIISELEQEPKLQEAVGTVLPIFCRQPQIFAQLLQLMPQLSKDVDPFDMITMVSCCLPFLTDPSSIQFACIYSVKLLRASKDQCRSLKTFCQFPATIRFLTVKSADAERDVAVSAISLLRRLIFSQTSNKVSMSKMAAIDFTVILQGDALKIIAGLKLLYELVTHHDHSLFLDCSSLFDLGLFHSLHLFARQSKTASQAWKILTALVSHRNYLAFSLAIPFNVRLVCLQGVHSSDTGVFLRFLALWLGHVVAAPFTQVPVNELRHFLDSVPDFDDNWSKAVKLLDDYQNAQGSC